jgi:hypothetical protein
MRAGQPQLPERRAVGAQLVSHQQFRHKPLLSEKLAHQPQCRPTVAAALDQHVEDLAFVVDGTPEIHSLAGDPNDHLVPQRSELQYPAPDGLVGDVEPSLGKEILDVSVAEREPQVDPDRMLYDNRRKPVTSI